MECFALNRVITFSQEGGLLPLITLVRGRRLELQLKEKRSLTSFRMRQHRSRFCAILIGSWLYLLPSVCEVRLNQFFVE